MRLPCEIVQDLLPLYEENMCSAVSREAVEEHLRECPNCRELSTQVQGFAEPEMEVSGQTENQAVVKSFRKVRRRWFASLVAVLLVIPMVLLCVNQYRGEGICFTNLDDILAARKAAKALGREDFEEFAEYMDYEKLYREIQDLLAQPPSPYDTEMVHTNRGDALLTQYEYYQETYGEVADMTLEEFTEVMKARYVADLQELADQGVSFDFRGLGFSYYIDEDGCWIIEYQMTVTIHGKIQPMSIGFAVQEGGLMIISTSYPGETRLDFDVAEALFMHYAR